MSCVVVRHSLRQRADTSYMRHRVQLSQPPPSEKENEMTEPTVNIPLLRKAVEWAEAEAAKPWELCEWYQGWFKTPASEVSEGAWVDDRYVTNAQVKAPSCGTCFCIAGWITEQTLPSELTLHKDGFLLLDPNGLTVTDAEEFASKQLGLDAGRHPLFNGGNTIEDVRRIAESIAGEAL